MAGEFEMNSEAIEVSKLLSEAAKEFSVQAKLCKQKYPDAAKKYRKWAAAIRSVILPAPGEPDEKA